MISIDAIAYQSRLKDWYPRTRISITLGVLLVSVLLNSTMLYLLIFAASLIGSVSLTTQDLKSVLKIVWIPMLFVGVSSCLIAINIKAVPQSFGIRVAVTEESIAMASDVLIRSLATVTLMLKMSLTLPMTHVIAWMNMMNVPSAFVELFTLSYKMIFSIFEEASELIVAQQLRFGFISPLRSFKSVLEVSKMLFYRVFWRMHDIDSAMHIRFYYED